MLKILFFGDIVGAPGRTAFMRILPVLKERYGADFVIANGENAASGRGITPGLAQELLSAGVDVVTTGDHVWDQKELAPWLNSEPRVLRPLNYPPITPGHGCVVVETPKGKIGVMQLQGRSFMQPPLENPFLLGAENAVLLREKEHAAVIFVDMHAETTSEKIAMGYHLDGLVSAIVGTHTHVQTADEKILPGGTAYLTDVGMCGPENSVLGREKEAIIRRFCTSMPAQFPVAGWPVRICGVVIEIDEQSGKAVSIERIQEMVEKG